MITRNELKWEVLKVLPTDYTDYGGSVIRWEDDTKDYPDCSSGCKYWMAFDSDWGVCLNKDGPRAGLLTWEHQAGIGCFDE
jgi:hypothetical protein